ncbi:MAG: EamA family transporter [Myxococcales bacterium]|nr:EamA family transporter [Myxococcales bacterium]
MHFALLLTVASALCWSTFDVCRKSLVTHTRPVPLAAILAWAQAPVFGLWALSVGDTAGPELGYLWPGLATLALNLGASIGFFAALRRGDLSKTVPLLSLSPVFSALMGQWILDEQLRQTQWGGIGLVVTGALFLAWPKGDQKSGEKADFVGSLLMIMTAALWAGTAVYDKVSLDHVGLAMHAGLQTVALAVVLTAGLLLSGRAGEMTSVRRRPAVFWASVLVSTAALGLQLEAVQRIQVGLMESIKRATGMVSAIVLGRLLFAEPLSATKWLSVCAMAVGVWLLVN